MTVAAEPLCVRLHGVTVCVQAGPEPFLAYLRTALGPLASQREGTADVVSCLEWVDGLPTNDPRQAFGLQSWECQPDRDLYVAGPRAWWLRIDEFPQLQLALEFCEEGRLRVVGRYHFALGRRLETLRRLRHWRRLKRLRSHRFSTLAYYLVYYPLLWRLSRFGGQHVVHGAATSRGGRAEVLFGMPGCGKSSAAVARLGDPSVAIVSDNLLLHDGDSVRACPELLLLDGPSVARLPAGARGRLEAAGDRRVFERDAYRPDSFSLGPHPVAWAAWVERGLRTRVERIAPSRCAALALAGNATAKEVRRFDTMAAVLDVVAGTAPGNGRGDLERLLARVPCYRVCMGPDEPPGEAFARLEAKADAKDG